MSKCVCDKCGHEFAINPADFEEIRRDDIIVQYFCCPACLAKYHICTTDSVMRRLIRKRLKIQNEIAGSPSARKSHRLKDRLDKVITQQNKLSPKLKKIGVEILNGGDNTE
ncbi:MAG: hypothetical protein K2J47_01815 [Ruminococcus sp.]|nr:hypothetical protein [Ruminococcus sp.]